MVLIKKRAVIFPVILFLFIAGMSFPLSAELPKIIVLEPEDLSDTNAYPSSYIFREIIFRDIYNIVVNEKGFDVPDEEYLIKLSAAGKDAAGLAIQEKASVLIFGDYKFTGDKYRPIVAVNIYIEEFPSGIKTSYSYQSPADIGLFASMDVTIDEIIKALKTIRELEASEVAEAAEAAKKSMPVPMPHSFKKQGFPVMIGFQLSAIPVWSGSSFDNTSDLSLFKATSIPNSESGEISGSDYTEAELYSSATVFIDLKYVRIDTGIGFSLGAPDIINETVNFALNSPPFNTNLTRVTTNNVQSMTFTSGILLKYPIEIAEGFSIWPGAGVEYHYILYSETNGLNAIANDYNRRDSWWLKGGIGADIRLSEDWYLTPSIVYMYDLTPVPYYDTQNFRNYYGVSLSDYISDMNLTVYIWDLVISIGAAYRF